MIEYILLDLFAGVGGFHLGLNQAGFKFTKVYYSENNKYAMAVYKKQFKDAEYVGPIENVQGADLQRPNIIAFGSPCQGFSPAGKRAGMGDPRSFLISHAIRLITEKKPNFFIWENVKGAFSSNNREDFWAIIKAFTDIGNYRLEWQLLNTAWFLPQNRERIFLVGSLGTGSKRQIFPIGKPSKIINKRNSEIANTLQHPGHSGGNYRGMTLIRHRSSEPYLPGDIAPTVRNSDKAEVRILDLKTASGTSKTRRGGISTDLCPTLDHNCNIGILNKNRIRRLTPIETERLQGFPDDWTKFGIFPNSSDKKISDSQRYKMMGNAASVPVVKAVGERIIASMN